MKKSIWVTVVVLTLAVGVSAQTTNPNYEVTPFGDPPYEDATGRDRDTISVAADGKGSILVLRRSEPPVLVFNREGELQKAWGTGLFTDTHNIDIDHEGYVWIGDRNGQMVYKFTMDGEQLLALGTKGVRATTAPGSPSTGPVTSLLPQTATSLWRTATTTTASCTSRKMAHS